MRNHPFVAASIATLSLCLGVYVALIVYAEHLQAIGVNPFS
jgi:hypothetical protein